MALVLVFGRIIQVYTVHEYKQKWYGMIGLDNNYKSSYILVNLHGTSIHRLLPSSKPFLFRASSINSMMNILWWFFVIIVIICTRFYLVQENNCNKVRDLYAQNYGDPVIGNGMQTV